MSLHNMIVAVSFVAITIGFLGSLVHSWSQMHRTRTACRYLMIVGALGCILALWLNASIGFKLLVLSFAVLFLWKSLFGPMLGYVDIIGERHE